MAPTHTVSIVDSTVASLLLGHVNGMSEADTYKQAKCDLDRLRRA